MRLWPAISFRAVLRLIAGIAVFATYGKAGACELSILTSYPSSFYKPFIDLFVQKTGAEDVCVQNKNTIGLISHVRENRRPVPDIVWASSPVAFELLDQQDALAKFPDKVSKPIGDGGIQPDAPDGSRFGFALSTIGVMSGADQPFGNGPIEIADLASPDYYGLLGMSSPSRSGTTHLFVESLLQQYGWQDGWALLSQIGGNLATVTARSFGVRDGVARNRFPYGIGIDFLAQSEPQTGDALLFQSFSPGWYFPASVAVTGLGAQNVRSLEFVDFLRGAAAQQLLLQPEIRRIPIDPKLWPQAGFLPSANNPAQGLELRKLWQSLRRLEATPVIAQSDATKPLLSAVRDALESVPVAAFMANEHSFERVFSDVIPSENTVVGRLRVQDSWSNDFSQRFKSARELIARMDSFQSHLDTGTVK